MDDIVSVVCAGFRQVSHGSTDPVVHVKAIKQQQDVVKRGDILAKIKWMYPLASPSAAAASSSAPDSEVHKVVVRSPVDGMLLAWLVPESKACVPLKCPAWVPIVSNRPGVHENMGAFIRLAVVAECSHPGEFKGACVSCGYNMAALRKVDSELPSPGTFHLVRDSAVQLYELTTWDLATRRNASEPELRSLSTAASKSRDWGPIWRLHESRWHHRSCPLNEVGKDPWDRLETADALQRALEAAGGAPARTREASATAGASGAGQRGAAGTLKLRARGGHELVLSSRVARASDEAASQRLRARRKLRLVLDIDHTLLHATADPRALGVPRCPVHIVQFGGGTYFVKLRPGVRAFLRRASRRFELGINTAGTRDYADAIARLLDPERKLFGHRIISRSDNEGGDGSSKSQAWLHSHRQDDSMTVILDDTEAVWGGARNLLVIARYVFFRGFRDVNNAPGQQAFAAGGAPRGPGAGAGAGSVDVQEEPRLALADALDVLEDVHAAYYGLSKPGQEVLLPAEQSMGAGASAGASLGVARAMRFAPGSLPLPVGDDEAWHGSPREVGALQYRGEVCWEWRGGLPSRGFLDTCIGGNVVEAAGAGQGQGQSTGPLSAVDQEGQGQSTGPLSAVDQEAPASKRRRVDYRAESSMASDGPPTESMLSATASQYETHDASRPSTLSSDSDVAAKASTSSTSASTSVSSPSGSSIGSQSPGGAKGTGSSLIRRKRARPAPAPVPAPASPPSAPTSIDGPQDLQTKQFRQAAASSSGAGGSHGAAGPVTREAVLALARSKAGSTPWRWTEAPGGKQPAAWAGGSSLDVSAELCPTVLRAPEWVSFLAWHQHVWVEPGLDKQGQGQGQGHRHVVRTLPASSVALHGDGTSSTRRSEGGASSSSSSSSSSIASTAGSVSGHDDSPPADAPEPAATAAAMPRAVPDVWRDTKLLLPLRLRVAMRGVVVATTGVFPLGVDPLHDPLAKHLSTMGARVLRAPAPPMLTGTVPAPAAADADAAAASTGAGMSQLPGTPCPYTLPVPSLPKGFTVQQQDGVPVLVNLQGGYSPYQGYGQDHAEAERKDKSKGYGSSEVGVAGSAPAVPAASGHVHAPNPFHLMTHVAVGRPGTSKALSAVRSASTRVVSARWLGACCACYRPAPEREFPVAPGPADVRAAVRPLLPEVGSVGPPSDGILGLVLSGEGEGVLRGAGLWPRAEAEAEAAASEAEAGRGQDSTAASGAPDGAGYKDNKPWGEVEEYGVEQELGIRVGVGGHGRARGADLAEMESTGEGQVDPLVADDFNDLDDGDDDLDDGTEDELEDE